MNLIYFTKDAYKHLKKDLASNNENYYSEELWLEAYFAKVGIDEYVKTSSVVVPKISLIHSGDDIETKNQDDLNNIKILYGAYKDKITPLQASDPMLWSALCHITYRDYVRKRWKKMMALFESITGSLLRRAELRFVIIMLYRACGGPAI